jgi:hypothetical protein
MRLLCVSSLTFYAELISNVNYDAKIKLDRMGGFGDESEPCDSPRMEHMSQLEKAKMQERVENVSYGSRVP